jgi:hypothetical protein
MTLVSIVVRVVGTAAVFLGSLLLLLFALLAFFLQSLLVGVAIVVGIVIVIGVFLG